MSRPDPFQKYGGKADGDPFSKYGGKADAPRFPLQPKGSEEPSMPDFARPGLKSALDIPLDIGIGIEQASGIDPMHPIRSLPGAVLGAGKGLVDLATNTGPILSRLGSAMNEAVTSGGQALRSGNLPEAAQAVGRGFALGEGVKGFAKLGAGALKSPSLADALQERANINKARAIAPTTLQGKADIGQVAGEVSRGGRPGALEDILGKRPQANELSGFRGSTIDRNAIANLEKNGQRVGMVEDRLRQEVRPEYQTPKSEILNEIDSARAKLNIPRTNVTAHPEAVERLNDVRNMVNQMPDYIDFDQLVTLRRQLDQRADAAGGFGMGDTLKAKINRGVADIVRGKLNDLDPELKAANHDYSVSRKVADTVNRRQLAEVGKTGTAIPGRGAILDDVLATWAGHAMGGTVGGALAEGLNLIGQSRGFSNLKSGMYQWLADAARPPMRAPAGLLNAQPPLMGAVPDTSSVTGVPGEYVRPRPPLLLPVTKPLLELPQEAGSPYVTPINESLLETARRLSRSQSRK